MENTYFSLKDLILAGAFLLSACGQHEVRDLQTRQDAVTNNWDRDRDELRQELVSLRRDIDEMLFEVGTRFSHTRGQEKKGLNEEIMELEVQRRKVQDSLNLLDVTATSDQELIHEYCRSVIAQIDGWFDRKAEMEDLARTGM